MSGNAFDILMVIALGVLAGTGMGLLIGFFCDSDGNQAFAYTIIYGSAVSPSPGCTRLKPQILWMAWCFISVNRQQKRESLHEWKRV